MRELKFDLTVPMHESAGSVRIWGSTDLDALKPDEKELIYRTLRTMLDWSEES